MCCKKEMEKNPSCISFGSVDMHNAQWPSDYTKTIVGELLNRTKPFRLASPMQWKHAIFIARVPRCLHHVKKIGLSLEASLYGLFGLNVTN
jgi:hypothetical protein